MATDRRFGMGNILVVLQVALSLVLVIAAGLFMRTFSSLANLDLGFERDPVVVVSVGARQLALEPADRAPFFERVREAVQGVPGAASSALSAVTPVSGSTWQFLVEIPGGPDLPERERGVHVNLVSPDFFKTMGTRVIAGRDFTAADRRGAPDVVIVNEAFAKKFFNGQNPVGRIVKQPPFPDRPATTHAVVGYVQDAVYRSPRQAIPPTMYLPLAQHPEPPVNINLSVRAAAGSPALLIKPLADALTGVNKDLTVTFRPLAEQVNARLDPGACHRDAVRILRSACAAAGRPWPVRRDVVRGESAASRARDPDGTRRGARRCRPAGAAAGRAPGWRRHRPRHRARNRGRRRWPRSS